MNKLITLPIGDFIISIFALYFTFLQRLDSVFIAGEINNFIVFIFIFFAFILIFLSFILEMYNQEKNGSLKVLLVKTCIGVMIAFVIFSLIDYLLSFINIEKSILLMSLIFFGILQFFWHVSYKILKIPGISQKILIIGAGSIAEKIGQAINSVNNNYKLAGYVNIQNEIPKVPRYLILENNNGLEDLVSKEKINKIVVSLSERRGIFPIRDVLNCKFRGISIVDAATFYEEITGKLLIEDIKPSWFIFSDKFRISFFKLLGKRLIDIFVGSLGLLITAVFFPVIALLIKIDSPGPIFYRQQRVGEKEKLFTLYKFRTMFEDAENMTGPTWAGEDDPRITKVGKKLRKFRLDEFPQFYNVLKGDMSVIGPRPERLEFVEKLKKKIPFYSERHYVKPGITGWAQIRYPYGASERDALEKLRYDLYYIKNMSFFLDFIILFSTVKIMILGRGAR